MEGTRKVNRLIKHYNLDAIISVGYRVNSRKGTQFRIWANQMLKDYLLQGFALNEIRLKQQVEAMSKLKDSFTLVQRAPLDSLDQVETNTFFTRIGAKPLFVVSIKSGQDH